MVIEHNTVIVPCVLALPLGVHYPIPFCPGEGHEVSGFAEDILCSLMAAACFSNSRAVAWSSSTLLVIFLQESMAVCMSLSNIGRALFVMSSR